MSKIITMTIEEWLSVCSSGAAPCVRIKLNGTSMCPLVRRNRDYVTVSPIFDKPSAGDIVMFRRSDGEYVVHRVLKVNDNTLQTLGDACMAPDTPIEFSSLCGLIIKVERGSLVLKTNTAVSRFFGKAWMSTLSCRRFVYRARAFIGKRVRRVFGKWKKTKKS